MDLTKFQTRFADRVRRLRLERGLRQDDLESYGLAWKTIQNIEYGATDIRISTVLKLCEAFNMTILELLDLDSGEGGIEGE